jgi:hypothetical protein
MYRPHAFISNHVSPNDWVVNIYPSFLTLGLKPLESRALLVEDCTTFGLSCNGAVTYTLHPKP